MEKKLQLETKIRDAAVSLFKVNAAHKNVSKRTSEQLEAANRKVENVQKDLWRLSERTNEVSKKLLEHRAGVLSFQLRSLETKPLSQLRFWKEISKLLRLKSTLWIHAITTRP